MKTRIALLSQAGAPRPYDQSKPLRIVEAELAEPGAGEMRVRMAAAGLCHSDLSTINGDRPREMPIALGHEASAVVEAVGPHVTQFAVGDHVVLVFAGSCGQCGPCAEGRPSLCEPAFAAAGGGTLIGGDRKVSVDGTTVNHHLGVSAFSEHAIVAEASCVKIDKSVPLERAALLGCAVLTGVGAVLNSGQLRVGQRCAVIGLGGVGLSGVLGAIAGGARQVIAVDLAQDKLDFARELGATHTINPSDADAVAQVMEITDGGVDLAVELAGSVPALEFGWNITRRGGTCVTAGLPHPDKKLEVPAAFLTVSEKTLRGSYVGSCVPKRDVPRFADLMMQGRLPIEKLMTHELALDDINEGFERLASGKAIRQVIRFDRA